MRDIIKKVPIPAAGLALGLAALGNLLQPYTEIAHGFCGILSLLIVSMLVAYTLSIIRCFSQLIKRFRSDSVYAPPSQFCGVKGTEFHAFIYFPSGGFMVI